MVKANYWGFLFPFITIFILILSLFYPIMYVKINYSDEFMELIHVEDYLWLFGRGGVVDALEAYIETYPEAKLFRMPLIMVVAVEVINIITISILSIISAIWITAHRDALGKVKIMWLVPGLLSIFSPLLLFLSLNIISMNINRNAMLTGSVTFDYELRLGMIFVILGGVVLILGYIVAELMEKT